MQFFQHTVMFLMPEMRLIRLFIAADRPIQWADLYYFLFPKTLLNSYTASLVVVT